MILLWNIQIDQWFYSEISKLTNDFTLKYPNGPMILL